MNIINTHSILAQAQEIFDLFMGFANLASFGIISVAACEQATGVTLMVDETPGVVMGIVTLIGMWKVFAKAGQPGWAVLIPFFNIIVLLRVAALPWYWVFTPPILLLLEPSFPFVVFAYLAWIIWVHHRISTNFGQGVGFTIAAGIAIAAATASLLGNLLGWGYEINWGFELFHHLIVLTLLAPIFWLILGYGSSKFVGEQPAQA